MKYVKDIFAVGEMRYTDGEIGIEIEVEGKNLPVASKKWRIDHDGSLKAAESGEYVLRKPLCRADARKALAELYISLNTGNTEMYESVKAGVHIHLNVQDYTLIEMINFITVYILFEEVLVAYCGEYREGNLFCLRSSDAPYIIHYLTESIADCEFSRLDDEVIRYCSINLMALKKYGSLEFRAMRSTPDYDVIVDWIDLLLDVKAYAQKFETPIQIIEEYSELDLEAHLHNAFGNHSRLFHEIPDIGGKIKNGMRNAQEIAYCVKWDKAFKRIEDNIFYAIHAQVRGKHKRNNPAGVEPALREDDVPIPAGVPVFHGGIAADAKPKRNKAHPFAQQAREVEANVGMENWLAEKKLIVDED